MWLCQLWVVIINFYPVDILWQGWGSSVDINLASVDSCPLSVDSWFWSVDSWFVFHPLTVIFMHTKLQGIEYLQLTILLCTSINQSTWLGQVFLSNESTAIHRICYTRTYPLISYLSTDTDKHAIRWKLQEYLDNFNKWFWCYHQVIIYS
mgnify:CR=1 FL=1